MLIDSFMILKFEKKVIEFALFLKFDGLLKISLALSLRKRLLPKELTIEPLENIKIELLKSELDA